MVCGLKVRLNIHICIISDVNLHVSHAIRVSILRIYAQTDNMRYIVFFEYFVVLRRMDTPKPNVLNNLMHSSIINSWLLRVLILLVVLVFTYFHIRR